MFVNKDRLRDFSEKMDYGDIYVDLTKNYQVTNLDYDYDDAMDVLVSTLLDDYKEGYINYRAYISKGIDARILFELRKNLLLKFVEPTQTEYINAHNQCKTIEDLKKLRTQTVQQYYKGYNDLDFQYALICRELYGFNIMEFYFDFDVCFKDSKSEYQRTPETYRDEFEEYMLESFKKSMPKAFGKVGNNYV